MANGNGPDGPDIGAMSRQFFRQMQQERGMQTRMDPEARSRLREAVDGRTRFMAAWKNLAGTVVDSAVLSPTEAVLEIPGLLGVDAFEPWEQQLESFRAGNAEARSRRAFNVGLSEGEAAFIEIAGELIGFTAPAVGALKVGSLLRGSRRILPVDPIQDVTAGLIFGGALTPNEEAKDRGQAALIEGGMFGAFGIVARGIYLPIKRIRTRRIAERAEDKRISEIIERLGGDRPPMVSGEDEARSLVAQLNEEDWIINSPAAQRLLERNSEDAALVQGVLDMAETGGNIGILRQVRDPQRAIRRIEEAMPALRGRLDFVRADGFTRPAHLRGQEGTYDLVFGTSKLSSRKRSQLKQDGRYEGQRVVHSRTSREFEYLRRTDKRVAVKDLEDGSTKYLKPENVKDMPYGVVPDERAPELTALYSDFKEFYNEKNLDALRSRGQESMDDFVRKVRSGGLELDEPFILTRVEGERAAWNVVSREGKQVGTVAGAVDDAGVLQFSSLDEGAQALLEETGEAGFRSLGRQAVLSVREAGEEIAGVLPPGASGPIGADDLISSSPYRLRFMNEPYAIVYPHEAGLRTEDLLTSTLAVNARRAEAGLPPIPTGIDALEAAGIEAIRPVPPQPLSNFSDVFEAWAKDRGFVAQTIDAGSDVTYGASSMIPGRRYSSVARWDGDVIPSVTPTGSGSTPVTINKRRQLSPEPRDLEATRSHFANIMRRELLDGVPEDSTLFMRIQNRLFSVTEDMPDSLSAAAARVGFHASRRADGTTILREINTGGKIHFQTEADAKRAIGAITRKVKDEGFEGSMLPEGMIHASGLDIGLLRGIDGELMDPNVGMLQQAQEGIPGRSITNFRDWIVNADKDFGSNLFTRYVDPLIRGHGLATREALPWIRQVDKLFKGKQWNSDAMNQLGEFMTRVEEQALELNRILSTKEKVAIGKQMGLSNPERFARQSDEFTKIMRAGAREYGFEEARIIPEYFGRMRTWAAKHGEQVELAEVFPEGIPSHWEWAADMMRVGEMSNIELNPAIMATKWFQGAAKNRHMKEPWDELARVVGQREGAGLKIGDLSPGQQAQIREAVPELKQLSESEFLARQAVPEPTADVVREFLTMIRGMPNTNMRNYRNTFQKVFKELGVDVDPRILDEVMNIGLSSMYGAGLGARLLALARNLTQTPYLTGTRLGFRDANVSLERAMSLEGFKELEAEGVIRAASGGGLPMHDRIFEQLSTRMEGSGLLGTAIASSMRKALRLGQWNRKLAEKTLIPYTATDEVTRGWSYFWHKEYNRRVFERFNAGKISQAKMLEDLSPGMARNLREEALRIRKRQGDEKALRYLARWGADEDIFIYGAAVQPPWMQSPFGRFVGMFGTWPLWLKSHYGRVNANMTPRQRVSHALRTGAVTGALALTGYSMGVNMWSWIAPTSLGTYAGGPGADLLVDTKRLIEAPMDQKAGALRNLVGNVGGLAIPGQVLFREATRTARVAHDPAHAVLLMGLGRPNDGDHWFFDSLFYQRPIDRVRHSEIMGRWLNHPDGWFEDEPPPEPDPMPRGRVEVRGVPERPIGSRREGR